MTDNLKGANSNKSHFQLNLAVRSRKANDEIKKSDQYVCIECNHFFILNGITNNIMLQEDILFSSLKRG